MFVIADDVRLLLVAENVTVQLKDLSASVLQHGGLVDSGTGADTLAVVALLQKTVNTANRELESGTGRTSLGFDLLGDFASFTFS